MAGANSALISQSELFAPARTTVSTDDVADRIVAIRKARGLTLQDCAKITGVSTSALSKIERRDLSPTLTTLQKIASGLEIDLAELLSSSRPNVPSQGRRAVSRAADQSSTRELLSRTCENILLCNDLRDKRMVPARTRVTARSTDEYPDWPSSDAEIFVFVLSGRMQLHTRIYEPLELGPGDSVYYDASGEHCWTSVGPEDAEVLWLVTP
ncbi:XRE family transcriptional regulator [Pseudooceanicola sp. CBS1P-1]|nr:MULTISPECIES: XRE family transcriptional regulator [Pseudooceanicola]MBT9384412.1 XRE family transcriptional regulator [Pseudooceanicola endophyticus]